MVGVGELQRRQVLTWSVVFVELVWLLGNYIAFYVCRRCVIHAYLDFFLMLDLKFYFQSYSVVWIFKFLLLFLRLVKGSALHTRYTPRLDPRQGHIYTYRVFRRVS